MKNFKYLMEEASMDKILSLSWIKAPIAMIVAFISEYLSSAPQGLKDLWGWLVIMFIVDTVLGITVAVYNRQISSKGLVRGSKKLFSYLSLMIVAAAVDAIVHSNHVVANIVVTYLILTEVISITENVKCLGLPLPRALSDTLEKLQNQFECETPEESESQDDDGNSKRS